MPLKLSLRPGEKFVLNGVVIHNGDARGVLVLQNKASVLRERDIMQAEEATSPARRVYFPVMMMYLDEAAADQYQDELTDRLGEVVAADPDMTGDCEEISRRVQGRDYYRALTVCRKLIEREDDRSGRDGAAIPDAGSQPVAGAGPRQILQLFKQPYRSAAR